MGTTHTSLWVRGGWRSRTTLRACTRCRRYRRYFDNAWLTLVYTKKFLNLHGNERYQRYTHFGCVKYLERWQLMFPYYENWYPKSISWTQSPSRKYWCLLHTHTMWKLRRQLAWTIFRHPQILALRNLEDRAIFNKSERYSSKLDYRFLIVPSPLCTGVSIHWKPGVGIR